MNIDLLIAYYSKGCNSRDLFANLKIAQNPDFEKHLNKYNVIWMNLPKFKEFGSKIEELLPTMIEELKRELKEEFPQYKVFPDLFKLFCLISINKLMKSLLF